MLIIRISGDLGNQIAQLALGRYFAAELNQELKYDLSHCGNSGSERFHLMHWIEEVQIATQQEVATARNSIVFSTADELENSGRAQPGIDAYLNFSHITDLRRWEPRNSLLKASIPAALAATGVQPDLANRIVSTPSVALHLMATTSETVDSPSGLHPEYFQDALAEMVQAVPDAHIFVFTDQVDWARNFLPLTNPHTYVATDQLNENLNTFNFMRLCRHHVVSRHALSIVSALLAEMPGKTVVPQVVQEQDDDPNAPGTPYRWPETWYPMPQRLPSTALDLRHIAGGFSTERPIRIGVWNFYEDITTDGFLFKNSNASIGHNLLKPWCDLYQYGQANGLHFVTMDQTSGPDDIDAIIFMDRPSNRNPMVQRLMESKIPKYLCIYETEVIKPDNWDLSYHAHFSRVFTWSDAHVDGMKYLKINYAFEPVPVYDIESFSAVFDQRKFCTLIAGAKQSSHRFELYSQRIDAIQWFQAHAPHDFEFYGVGWNAAGFPSYKGRVQNKLATLAQYKFCICYENATGYDGYITEKIFDCFLAGTVPIYWGAPNITDWIPADCFIDRRNFNSISDLHAHLKGMDEKAYAGYLSRIKEFLTSRAAYAFSNENFVTTITAAVAKDVRTQRAQIPDVTVIIPNYNYGKYLRQAISSVLNQSDVDLEVIVLDNASTDNTTEVLSEFEADPRVHFMSNLHNIGAPLNWRNGLKVAAGRFVTVLSADDFHLPGHLRRMVERMKEDPDLTICYCPIMQVDENSHPIEVLRHPGHPPHDYFGPRNEIGDLLAFDCYITPSAALIRRSSLDSVGEINTSLHGAIDWELWIRIAEKSGRFGFFKEALVCYRVHPEQDTSRLNTKAGLLEDHVAILWGVLLRGKFSHLQQNAKQTLGIIYGKYMAYPEHVVSHLIPQINALRGLLLGELELEKLQQYHQTSLHATQSLLASRSGTASTTLQ